MKKRFNPKLTIYEQCFYSLSKTFMIYAALFLFSEVITHIIDPTGQLHLQHCFLFWAVVVFISLACLYLSLRYYFLIREKNRDFKRWNQWIADVFSKFDSINQNK